MKLQNIKVLEFWATQTIFKQEKRVDSLLHHHGALVKHIDIVLLEKRERHSIHLLNLQHIVKCQILERFRLQFFFPHFLVITSIPVVRIFSFCSICGFRFDLILRNTFWKVGFNQRFGGWIQLQKMLQRLNGNSIYIQRLTVIRTILFCANLFNTPNLNPYISNVLQSACEN